MIYDMPSRCTDMSSIHIKLLITIQLQPETTEDTSHTQALRFYFISFILFTFCSSCDSEFLYSPTASTKGYKGFIVNYRPNLLLRVGY